MYTLWHASVSPLVLLIFIHSGVVARAANTLPDDERKAITSLVEKLVSIGLPDTKGGSYFVGRAIVKQRLDPAANSAVLPMQYCGKQSTVPGSKEIDYEF